MPEDRTGRRGGSLRSRRQLLRGLPLIGLAALSGCTLETLGQPLPPVTAPPVEAVLPPPLTPTPTPTPAPVATTASATRPAITRASIGFASWGSAATMRALQEIFAAFRKAEPGVDIEVRLDDAITPDTARGDLREGPATDVIRVGPEDVFDLTADGLVLPLDDLAARDLDMDALAPAATEARAGPGGEIGALSAGAVYLAVYYNLAHIEAAGIDVPTQWTDSWDIPTLEQAARRMVIADDDRTDRFGLATVPWVVRPWLAGAAGADRDGRFFSADETGSTMQIEPHVKALQRLATWQTVLDFELALQERFAAPFNGGLVSFYIDASDFAALIRPAVRWGVAPLPAWSGSAALTEGQELCVAVNPQTQEPEAAWRLASFFLSPEAQRALAREDVVIPFRREVLNDPAFLDPNRQPIDRSAWSEAIERDLHTPANPGAKAWHAMTERPVNAVRDGSMEAEAYLARADALITRQLRARDWSVAKNVRGYRQELPLGNLLVQPGEAESQAHQPPTPEAPGGSG